MENGKEGKEGEKGGAEEEREGDGWMVDVPGNVNDIVVTSQSTDHSHSTTTNTGPPNPTTTTTMSQMNFVPFTRTQTDANKRVNKVEETWKRGTKDVQTVPSNSANNTQLPCLLTVDHCPLSPKPTMLLEGCKANPTANEGVQEVRLGLWLKS